MFRVRSILLLAALVATSIAVPSNAAPRRVPYWASLRASEVMMRTGPGRNFPADWLYRRPGLPVKVVRTYTVAHSEWRRIEDPDGTQGWVQANLLSDQRTALVAGEVRPLHAKPDDASPVLWRAEPGVVGKISACGNGWCRFDVRGQAGFVRAAHVLGVEQGESLP